MPHGGTVMDKATKSKTIAEFPAATARWRLTKNSDLTPDQVAFGSDRKYWWQCPKGLDHYWEAGD